MAIGFFQGHPCPVALTSTITTYDPFWPDAYAAAMRQLAPIFSASLAEMHHVGSTAVPMLAAKPEIDILTIVRTAEVSDEWHDRLAALGFRRGSDLSPGHAFFKRDVEGVRTHKVHICVADHPSIIEMLGFRDRLRASEKDRIAYEALKRQLEQENEGGIAEYLARKRPFITAVLKEIGIDR
ncbi:GrpB family protein [Phenylobacterium sp.]|uniref:GrpB family protein n=1 Tax=Phenylobacterium sp. TaxID=1871053 RepID=UPI002733BDF7|nr:GrpB family protein [Phenylobacterium sp.]MDP3635153.1 GrpB family protein [Phenylobacterium sp.]